MNGAAGDSALRHAALFGMQKESGKPESRGHSESGKLGELLRICLTVAAKLVCPGKLPGVKRTYGIAVLVKINYSVHLSRDSDAEHSAEFIDYSVGKLRAKRHYLFRVLNPGCLRDAGVCESYALLQFTRFGVNRNSADGGGSDINTDCSHKSISSVLSCQSRGITFSLR